MTWIPKELTREQMAERRYEGVRLLEKGKLRKESLNASRASGRPSNLSGKQKKELLKKMSAGALASGFDTERWTLARVQALIKKEFGVHYHPNYMSRLLHDLGWSVQKPETRAMERDEELILVWVSKDWNRIKKSAAARRRNRV